MSQEPISRSRLLLDELLELPRLMIKMLFANIFFAALACIFSVLHHPVYYLVVIGGGVVYVVLDGIDWRKGVSTDVRALFSVRLIIMALWHTGTLLGLRWLVGDLLARNAGEGLLVWSSLGLH